MLYGDCVRSAWDCTGSLDVGGGQQVWQEMGMLSAD